jgi:hypothetical protein
VKFAGKVGDGDVTLDAQPGGITFQLAEDRQSATLDVAADALPGVQWLRLKNPHGATELFPFFVGLVPESGETEPNNRLAEAQAVVLPSVTINGVFQDSRDVDTFAVDLTAGQSLVAVMQAAEPFGSPMDGVVQIVTAAGAVIAQNDDDAGRDPRLAFTAPSDGRWFVRTFAFSGTPNSSISFSGGDDHVYRLTLTTQGVISHCQPAVQSGQQPDRPVTALGWNLSSPQLTLVNGRSATAERLALPFALRRVSQPVVIETDVSGQQLTLPIAVSGSLEAGVRDEFRFAGTAGQRIRVHVAGPSLGSMLDPLIEILKPDGSSLESADDISDENRDAQLIVTLPADGEYSIRVRDRFETGGERWFYVMTVELAVPSFKVTTAKTAWTLAADKPTEIPLSVERLHGFAEPISFEVLGLPDGVTAESPRSESEGESSKSVVLKLSGSAPAPFQSGIQIMARPETSSSQVVEFLTRDGSSFREFVLTQAPAAASP